MLEKRLEGLRLFGDAKMPVWSPDISGLDLENITYYVPPELAEKESWEDLPEEVKKTFDDLGIPSAEREYLGGVGAQYDSGVVYHRIQESLRAKGVVFFEYGRSSAFISGIGAKIFYDRLRACKRP